MKQYLIITLQLAIVAMVALMFPQIAHAGVIADVADGLGTGIFKFLFAAAAGITIIYKLGMFVANLMGITDQASSFGNIVMSTVISIVAYMLWTPFWETVAGFFAGIGL